jgi:hypothetical protein
MREVVPGATLASLVSSVGHATPVRPVAASSSNGAPRLTGAVSAFAPCGCWGAERSSAWSPPRGERRGSPPLSGSRQRILWFVLVACDLLFPVYRLARSWLAVARVGRIADPDLTRPLLDAPGLLAGRGIACLRSTSYDLSFRDIYSALVTDSPSQKK